MGGGIKNYFSPNHAFLCAITSTLVESIKSDHSLLLSLSLSLHLMPCRPYHDVIIYVDEATSQNSSSYINHPQESCFFVLLYSPLLYCCFRPSSHIFSHPHHQDLTETPFPPSSYYHLLVLYLKTPTLGRKRRKASICLNIHCFWFIRNGP